MNRNKLALACMAALSLGASVVTGCAGDRPLRNGVPNENLYLRKAFIIKPGEVDPVTKKPAADPGWMLKATVVETSTPNPLAETVLFTGAENNGMLVRFAVTQDRLQLLNQREISEDTGAIKEQETRTPEVIDAWGAEHGDLKLAVTSDGEKTNRFEENQELDWKIRQWVRVNLAKSDLSDFSLFGTQVSYLLGKCAKGASTTVVPNSILVDEDHDYMEWKTSITMPVNVEDSACMEAFGESGRNFFNLGRQNVTAIVKYSLVRATPTAEITYKPLEIDEKDPIKQKYGPILQSSYARDPESGQIAARQFAMRFDPQKDMVFYFAKGYPEENKSFFTKPGGIVDQTNAIFEKAGAKIRLVVKNYDQDIPEDADALTKERGREYGDIRYNFIRWMSDLDTGAPFIGVTQFVPDPRTGEILSGSINIADFPLKEFVAQRVDAFLSTIMCNASKFDEGLATQVCADFNSDKPWGPPMKETPVKDDVTGDTKIVLAPYPDTCQTGEIAPILPTVLDASYGKSSLYSKMQEFLGEPSAVYGPLGPRDFVPPEDLDFQSVWHTILPYYIFADPATNEFVTPVGDGGEFGPAEQYKALQANAEFHALTGDLDKRANGDASRNQGPWPFDPNGGVEGVEQFLTKFQDLQLSHRDYEYKRGFAHKHQMRDEASNLVSFTGVMEKAGRHCVDGHWETREEWLDKLTSTYHALTVWHEFGHLLGLEHNFMASVDKQNFPRYKAQNCDPATDNQKCQRVGMYSSSVMEYSSTPDRIFWANESGDAGWGPYDRGAIGWIYANEGTLSAETKARAAEEYEKLGGNTSAYISKQISPTLPYNDPFGFTDDGKELTFLYCNESHVRFTPWCRSFDFGTTPSEIIANEIENYEWQYAWRNFRKYRKVWDLHDYADGPAKEMLELRRFFPPWRSDFQDSSLRDDFGKLKVPLPPGANAAEAYYGQLSTKFDDDFSQANQMVAAFHLALIQQSSGERPYATIVDKFNGDVTQQGITLDKNFAMQGWVGLWPSDNYDPNQRGNYIASYSNADPEYAGIAEKAVASMIGEERFDSFPYLRIAAVVLFARDTHNPNFNGRLGMKDWVGGHLFSRTEDVETYFRDMAITNQRYPELGCATGPGQITDHPTRATCTYDPRVQRGRETTAVHLSDTFNEFDGPDGQRYAWAYFNDRRQWIFVQKDRHTATYKLVRDYTENVVKPQIVDERAYAYALPLKYAIDAYLRYEQFAPN